MEGGEGPRFILAERAVQADKRGCGLSYAISSFPSTLDTDHTALPFWAPQGEPRRLLLTFHNGKLHCRDRVSALSDSRMS